MVHVVVTGPTGFIGRYLVRGLIDAGFKVTATVRSRSASSSAVPRARTACIGSIETFQRWDEILAGVDAVVHLAALAHRSESYQIQHRDVYAAVNADATRQLAEAAARSGVRHFIFLSTIGVHGSTTDERPPFIETDPYRPRGVYAETKVAAERALSEVAARTGLGGTIVRPPVVYGHGAPGNVEALLAAIRRGLPLPLASIQNHRAFVAVDNLIGFVLHRLSQAPIGLQPMIVADERTVSTAEFIRALAAAARRPARLVPFPPRLIRQALLVLGQSAMADSLLSSLEASTTRARATGWQPALRLEAGLQRHFAPLS